MIVACFLISIFTGLVAALLAYAGGFGLGVVSLAYSLCGAFALVLSMSVACAFAPSCKSSDGSDLPPP